LVASAVVGLVLGQDTGGPYTGLSGSCIDNKGQMIEEGRLFEPGPDECQVCTCLRQLPVLCRTVLCAPPQGCRSLRVGDACCEWTCDQWDTQDISDSVSDIGLRLMASAITAIFSLSLLFFLIYRLRQRKLRSRQNHLEAEGYSQEEVMEEHSGQCLQLESLKPQDRVMLTRPFPPSYNEAMFGSASISAAEHLETESNSPPYNTISQDPVVSSSYPVATLGRLVLPAITQDLSSSSNIRRVLRRTEDRVMVQESTIHDSQESSSSSSPRPLSSSSNMFSTSSESEATQTYV